MNQISPSGFESGVSSTSDRRLHWGFGLTAVAVLSAPFLFDSIHAAPATDDFCYAAQYTKSGFLGSIEHYYNNVNGRFFATFLNLSLGRLFPIEHAYMAFPLISFASIAVAFLALVSALVSALTPGTMSGRTKAVLGLLSALVLISHTKNLSEVFYWLSASVTYVGAAAGTLLALACMLVLTRPDLGHSTRLLLVTLGGLAAFTAAGSFEGSAPIVVVSSAFCALVAGISKRPGMVSLAVIAAAAAFGLWLNLSSLGTATRAGSIDFDAGKSLIDLIAIAIRSFLWTGERLVLWGSRASVWFLAFAFFWAFRDQLIVDWKNDVRRRRAILATFIGLASLPYLATLPMFYAYSSSNPVRAHFIVDIFCLIFWLTVLSFAFANFGKALALDFSKVNCRYLSIGLFGAIFVTIAGTGNFVNASLDTLRGFAFSKQSAAQIRDVLDNPNRAHEVVLARNVTAFAPTLWVSDINVDPRRWRNVCFAEHLGAYGVRVEPVKDTKMVPKGWKNTMPKGWIDSDPQAIGRPRPIWPPE